MLATLPRALCCQRLAAIPCSPSLRALRAISSSTQHTAPRTTPPAAAAQRTPPQRALQRAAIGMAEAIDLTIPDSEEEQDQAADESPAAAAARGAAQRAAIMSFAKRRRLENQAVSPGAASGGAAAAAAAGPAAAAAAAAAAGAGAGPSSSSGSRQQAASEPSDAQPGAGAAAPLKNSDLRALHEARMQRQQQQQQPLQQQPPPPAAAAAAADDSPTPPSTAAGVAAGASAAQATGAGAPASRQRVSLLTYNVWFREDVAVLERMTAIADIIAASGFPTVLCLQEVTPLILDIFSSMPWWERYVCCPAPADAPYFTLLLVNRVAAPSATADAFEEVAFDNSCMGRSLRTVTVRVGGRTLLVGTSHLESPVPPHQWFSKERQQQMAWSLNVLHKAPYANIILAGDTNWTDSRDGAPLLPPGWCDAWLALHPADPGFTYDSKHNAMLAFKNPGLRLDRVFTKLGDFRLSSISIVGKDALPGVTHTHTYKSSGATRQLPVLPSDHFGLLLQLEDVASAS